MSTSATELAWAAGFFDGEGCVCRSGQMSSQIVLSQSSSDGVPCVLMRAQHAVGGLGKINGPYMREGRQPHYRYTIGKKEEQELFMQLLWPYLSPVKKEQARSWGVAAR